MLKSLKNLQRVQITLPIYVSRAAFGHGHGHHKEYDWRDDPAVNKDIYVDPRDIGWNPEKYTFPYQGKDDWLFPSIPADYKSDDVNLNLRPENRKSDVSYNPMRAPYWNERAEIAHEADYESEDLDFQPEDFKTQHFRKRGPIWPWLIIGNLFVIYFWTDFILQHFPDEDHWRVSKLPPLDYPDPDDTDDTDTWGDYHSKGGRMLVESGAVGDLWFDIVDGKKIARPFSGAASPMHDW